MGRWSREELEKAFHDYEDAVVEIGKTWDWASYADHFTEDASTSSTEWATGPAARRSGSGSRRR